MPTRTTRRRGRLLRSIAVGGLLLAIVSDPRLVVAAPGDLVFSDSFESGFGKWTTTSSNLSGINTMTASSPSRSLYLRGSTVTTTSVAIDARIPALRITAWVRRGSDAFSELPDSGEDLVFEYLDSTNAWVVLTTYPGYGTAGAIYGLDQTLGSAALHAGFRIRARLLRGSGGPPDNDGRGFDYWHIDDVVLREATPSTGLALGRCEEFNAGLSGWTVATGYGQAHVTGQSYNTASQSLALHGGTVTATSQTVDLGGLQDARLDFWLRRGADSFSEDPDTGEDFYVEYLNAAGQWKRLSTFSGDGTPGEISRPSIALSGSARHAGFRLRFGMTGRDGPVYDYWHVDSVCLTTESATAEWRFEEVAWSRSVDEVVDFTGGGADGSAVDGAATASLDAAIDGDPGTCRHGSFDGNGDGVVIPSSSDLDLNAAATYTIWMQPHTSSGTRHLIGTNSDPARSNRSQMTIYAQGSDLIGRAATTSGTYSIKTSLPTLNAWTHVALAFDGKSLVLYRNGQAAARTDFAETTLLASARRFGIGNDPETSLASFHGYLDEARVYPTALDSSRISAIKNQTHTCAVLATHFRISHDRSGASCQPESLNVRVLDALGNLVAGYGGTITLDTQSGSGIWTVLRGNGRLSNGNTGNGRATYSFDPTDLGDVTFALTYPSGPSPVDIDVWDAIGRDDDSEGLLAFDPSSFALTANPVPEPAPVTIDDALEAMTAGTSVPIHVTALGGTAGGQSCGVLSSYDGDRTLSFWFEPQDPALVPLAPLIDGTPVATSEASATRRVVRFARGRASVALKYKDTGRLALSVADASASPAVHGSTGSFVSRPADLRITTVRNARGVANPGVTNPTGVLFARAGEAFEVTVDAVDAEDSLTPSFGRERVPEGISLVSAQLVAPEWGRNGSTDEGTLDNATDFAANTTAGRFVGNRFAFDEVGAIRLQASVADRDFLGAGPVTGSLSGVVGRFAPDHFAVVVNAPRFATACAVGAFTWLGQPFGFEAGHSADLTVTAVSATGGTTVNYAGDWFRITNATLSHRSYRANGAIVDESGLPATTVDPTIKANNDGSASLIFSTGQGLSLVRTTPVAPFDAELELSLDVVDADATAYPSNPFRVGGTTTGTGIAFTNGKRFQLGRLRLDNAFGSELVSLPMRLRTQRFDGTAYVDDDADSCSRVPATNLVLTPSVASLATTASVANVPLLSGLAGLVFGAPGESGWVDVRVDLGATGANLPWLRADWPDDGNLDGALDDDPQARATFGIWEGRETLIFQREYY